MLVFGDLTGDIVRYGQVLLNNTTPEILAAESDRFIDAIIRFAIYNSCIGLAMLVLSYFGTLFFNFSGLRQIFKIRKIYLEKVLNQDIGWYDKNQTGDFASRMSE